MIRALSKVNLKFICFELFLCYSNIYKRTFAMNGLIEEAKKLAAYKAVDENIKGDIAVGIGSGSTVIYAVERLAQKIKSDKHSIVCVPTSFQARQLILEHKLVLGDLESYPELSCVIDGADEVDENLNLIKGGGGCLTQEKIVASCSPYLVIIADHTKQSKSLGDSWKKGVPIEVIPLAYVPVKKKIEKVLGGEAVVRMAKSKAGPVVTDNGNFIIDWKFPSTVKHNWEEVNQKLISIPGIVETGLFINMASKAYFGLANGTVISKDAPVL